jgi:adenylosuccinate synthase
LRAYIVVDLGFGDAGKGLLTDFLARQFDAGVVVRYNGGAQAGHNVIAPDGWHHTFAQFGSGTFIPGVKTYLSKHVVIHPGALLVEGNILAGLGIRNVFSRIRISDQALVITPFHQAANRIREIARGQNRHGSCGVGVGETVSDALLYSEDSVFAEDLLNPSKLRKKLNAIRDRKQEQLNSLCAEKSYNEALVREWSVFEGDEIIERWISLVSPFSEMGLVVPDSVLENWLRQSETVIFEGAQGILLDADFGFHPYTTWSDCTAKNARDLIAEFGPDSNVFQAGVMRSYAVRHGPGPLPTETKAIIPIVTEHNQQNTWQGPVRYGWFDAVLARYALSVAGELDALCVTHMDLIPRLDEWQYCPGYKEFNNLNHLDGGLTVKNDLLTGITPPHSLSLAERERFARSLCDVQPFFESCEAKDENVIWRIESLLNRTIDIISTGPKAKDVRILNKIPM